MRKILKFSVLLMAVGLVFGLAGCDDGSNGGDPDLTGSVSITGTAAVGQTLTADTSNLGGNGAITFLWKRGGTNIGSDSSTYVVLETDVGGTITVTVTRAGYVGSKTSTATAAVTGGDNPNNPDDPDLTGSVSITGTATVGQVLTANTNSLGGSGTISYQWKKVTDTSVYNIGSNSNTYTIQQTDVASSIIVTVTRDGYSGSVTSSATAVVTSGNNNGDPALTGTVSITGTAEVGQTLTASVTNLNGTGTITYQWKRGTTDIGTNSNTYTVVQADVGGTITVTATRAGYTGSVTSTATATVTGGSGGGGINWTNDANGTLTVINNTTKDMVLFQGQTPSISNIIGGVRGATTRTIDVSQLVDDFEIGGYLILRGITLDEYNANSTNLSRAKIEWNAMATYGRGKRFSTEIYPSYMGDYGYIANNIGRIGMELRKDSPDGEKIAYIPALGTNWLLYADNTDGFVVYPVYVYFNRQNGQVTTLKPTSMFDTVTVSPRALANESQLQSYIFPTDEGATWTSIMNTLSSPVAYVTITNNIGNQSGTVTIAGTNRFRSQNGFNTIASGETLTYEITSTVTGTTQSMVLNFYGGALQLPVLVNEGSNVTAGTNNIPILKNGYDYTVSVIYNGGTTSDASNYTVTIEESEGPRDLSDVIESL